MADFLSKIRSMSSAPRVTASKLQRDGKNGRAMGLLVVPEPAKSGAELSREYGGGQEIIDIPFQDIEDPTIWRYPDGTIEKIP